MQTVANETKRLKCKQNVSHYTPEGPHASVNANNRSKIMSKKNHISIYGHGSFKTLLSQLTIG